MARSGEQGELDLMREHGIEAVVTRNSGGDETYPKIGAARALGLPVVMIDRPQFPPSEIVQSPGTRWRGWQFRADVAYDRLRCRPDSNAFDVLLRWPAPAVFYPTQSSEDGVLSRIPGRRGRVCSTAAQCTLVADIADQFAGRDRHDHQPGQTCSYGHWRTVCRRIVLLSPATGRACRASSRPSTTCATS